MQSHVPYRRQRCCLVLSRNVILTVLPMAQSEYKWLHDVYFVHAIPRLPSGKIIAKHLKEMLENSKTNVDVIIKPPPSLSWHRESFFSRMSDLVSDLLKYKLY